MAILHAVCVSSLHGQPGSPGAAEAPVDFPPAGMRVTRSKHRDTHMPLTSTSSVLPSVPGPQCGALHPAPHPTPCGPGLTWPPVSILCSLLCLTPTHTVVSFLGEKWGGSMPRPRWCPLPLVPAQVNTDITSTWDAGLLCCDDPIGVVAPGLPRGYGQRRPLCFLARSFTHMRKPTWAGDRCVSTLVPTCTM